MDDVEKDKNGFWSVWRSEAISNRHLGSSDAPDFSRNFASVSCGPLLALFADPPNGMKREGFYGP